MAVQMKRSGGKPTRRREASRGADDQDSFRRFARKLRSRNPLLEAFKFHAAAPDFPEVDSWGELRSYLVRAGAQHEVMVSARKTWREFKDR